MSEIKVKVWGVLKFNKKQFIICYLAMSVFFASFIIYFLFFPIQNIDNYSGFNRLVLENFSVFWIVMLVWTIIEGQFYWTRFVKIQLQIIEKQKDELNNKNVEILAQNEEIKVQRDAIESQNKQTTDSIKYAGRIQNAVLPEFRLLNENFETFIFFKPRDIVSGDFFWTRIINNKQLFAVADCTGHGVPGAFLSMLGISFLNEIVIVRKIYSPDNILNELREMFKQLLHQRGNFDEQKDGMAIALLSIDVHSLEIEYAGAQNPLYIVSKHSDFQTNSKLRIFDNNIDSVKLYEIRPDLMPVGIHIVEKPFSLYKTKLQKEDKIYMFSDGFVDQFGGKNNEKYMSKNFKKLLVNIYEKNTESQKELMERQFIEWKGTNEQVDDILVMGIRIK